MGIDAIKGQMGVIQNFNTTIKLDEVSDEATNIPDNFDSRTAWPNCSSI